ncbi:MULTISPECIES: prepilin-type N-terminal cleavage/methylation domain-containing protein [unclassified Nitrospina]|uniref:prepilin-type N-terminal cleavage/methylation domain-containing protein n=1 Tax=unclassified Nitrospina TaxID=2638683 RepID=UPI003F9B56E4
MNFRHTLHNQRGMTMVEIILVIVILGIMIAVGAQFLFQSAEVDQQHSERVDRVTRAYVAMEVVVRELRIADPASIAIAGNNFSFDKQFGYPQDPATNNINYTYSPGAQTLQRNGGATTTIANNMTAFSITDNGGWYTISMTLSGTVSGNFTLTSAVRPRTLS